MTYAQKQKTSVPYHIFSHLYRPHRSYLSHNFSSSWLQRFQTFQCQEQHINPPTRMQQLLLQLKVRKCSQYCHENKLYLQHKCHLLVYRIFTVPHDGSLPS